MFAINLIGDEALYAPRDFEGWMNYAAQLDGDAKTALYSAELRPFSEPEIRNAECDVFAFISANELERKVDEFREAGGVISLGWNHVFTPVAEITYIDGDARKIKNFVSAIGIANRDFGLEKAIDPLTRSIEWDTIRWIRRSTPGYEELLHWGIQNLEISILRRTDCGRYELIILEGTER